MSATRLSLIIRGASICVVAAFLAGCESLLPPPPAPPPPMSAIQIYSRPPERALITGMRLYEEGSFDRAESAFKSALTQGLRDRRDVAAANKYLAFIACAFNRPVECETHFRSAITSDPEFRLTDAEIGHPIWGPVYRNVTRK